MLEIFSLDDDNNFHLKVTAVLGEYQIKMIVDTGASRTVFDKNSISLLLPNIEITLSNQVSSGLGTNSMVSHLALLPILSIGNLNLNDYETVILDLENVNSVYRGLGFEEVAGVLGCDILLKYGAVINFNEKSLVFSTSMD